MPIGRTISRRGIRPSSVTAGSVAAAPVAALVAGPDANGAVTTPSAGVLRYTKNAGGSAFNAGAYGPVRAAPFRYQITPVAAQDLFIGYDTNPAGSSGFADMVHALYVLAAGSMTSYDAGTAGPAPAFTTWMPGDANLGTFFADFTGTTFTIKQGSSYAGARTLLTYAASGSVGMDYCLFQQGSAFDVQVLV